MNENNSDEKFRYLARQYKALNDEFNDLREKCDVLRSFRDRLMEEAAAYREALEKIVGADEDGLPVALLLSRAVLARFKVLK